MNVKGQRPKMSSKNQEMRVIDITITVLFDRHISFYQILISDTILIRKLKFIHDVISLIIRKIFQKIF